MMLTVRIKKLPNGLDLPVPAKHSAEAAGFDLLAACETSVTLAPMQIVLVPCGFAIGIPPGFEGQVRARSGLASKHGVTLVNGVGTIDSDYRGEVKVPMINLGTTSHTIRRGDRIAQLLIAPVPAVQFVEVRELDQTSRGGGGFGHTGTSTTLREENETRSDVV